MRARYLEGLTTKQEQAIIALIGEPSIERAATKAGVGERTLHRWLGDERFQSAYRAARREAFTQAIGLTQKYAPMAVHQLARIVNDPATPHSARVSAAVALLKFSRESVELDDLVGRIEQLERASAAPNSPTPPKADGPDLKFG